MTGTAVTASIALTGIVMLVWIVWGIREYRRTGREQWLYMAILLTLSFFVMLTTYAGR